ncbi:hypothetical protein PYJP_16250 [Pyrofollis japonicus]|nr:hypothetical protein PYJP_16250 [Pyrofollis japonicus]
MVVLGVVVGLEVVVAGGAAGLVVVAGWVGVGVGVDVVAVVVCGAPPRCDAINTPAIIAITMTAMVVQTITLREAISYSPYPYLGVRHDSRYNVLTPIGPVS